MDAFDRKIRADIKAKRSCTTDAEIDEWQESTYHWAEENYRRLAKWIAHLEIMSGQPIEKVQVDRFYILMYGILVDARTYLTNSLTFLFKDIMKKKKVDIRTAINASFRRNWRMRNHLLTLADIVDALNSISSTFSAEEVFLITFFRHSYCHPVLDAYKVKLNAEGKKYTFDLKKYRTLRQLQPVDDLEFFEQIFPKLKTLKSSLKKTHRLFHRL